MPRKERDEKRRDNKGRLLKSGESQRSDGRYAYKYIDTFGDPQFVYSWKLVPTDKVPAGKRPCLSLREKIKQIQKDLDDGIDTIGKKMTVCQLYEKYTRQRGNVRKGTQKSRQQLMKLLSEDKLGAASIDSVKLSDAKEWALRIWCGVAYNTICNSKRSCAIFIWPYRTIASARIPLTSRSMRLSTTIPYQRCHDPLHRKRAFGLQYAERSCSAPSIMTRW